MNYVNVFQVCGTPLFGELVQCVIQIRFYKRRSTERIEFLLKGLFVKPINYIIVIGMQKDNFIIKLPQ